MGLQSVYFERERVREREGEREEGPRASVCVREREREEGPRASVCV